MTTTQSDAAKAVTTAFLAAMAARRHLESLSAPISPCSDAVFDEFDAAEENANRMAHLAFAAARKAGWDPENDHDTVDHWQRSRPTEMEILRESLEIALSRIKGATTMTTTTYTPRTVEVCGGCHWELDPTRRHGGHRSKYCKTTTTETAFGGQVSSALAAVRRVLRTAGWTMSKTTGRYSAFGGGTKRVTEGIAITRVGCGQNVALHYHVDRASTRTEREVMWAEGKRARDELRAVGFPFDDRGWMVCAHE